MGHRLIKNELGNKYGYLTVSQFGGSKKNRAQWICKCRCGNELSVAGKNLRNGNTKSCGCYARESCRTRKTLPHGEASFRTVYRYMNRNAKYRKLIWRLTPERARELFSQQCHYCGTPPRHSTNNKQHKKHATTNGEFIYNGIDRVDNKRGYLPDNVVSCCSLCNWMKRELGKDTFLEHIASIYHYFNKERKCSARNVTDTASMPFRDNPVRYAVELA